MKFEKPTVEFVEIKKEAMIFTSGCQDDGETGGGDTCIVNGPHSQGTGCGDTAPYAT